MALAGFSLEGGRKIKDTVDAHFAEFRNPPPGRGRWFGSHGQRLVAFALTADLTAGGTAAATEQDWDPATETYSTGSAITVEDTLGSTSAIVVMSDGEKGYAQIQPGDGAPVYEVVSPRLGGDAQIVECLADGVVLAADAAMDVDNVSVVHPRGGSVPSPTLTSVKNFLRYPYDDNTPILAIRNQLNGDWEGFGGHPIVTVSVVAAMQLNGSDDLQIKTRTITAVDDGTLSAWTTVTGWTTSDCP